MDWRNSGLPSTVPSFLGSQSSPPPSDDLLEFSDCLLCVTLNIWLCLEQQKVVYASCPNGRWGSEMGTYYVFIIDWFWRGKCMSRDCWETWSPGIVKILGRYPQGYGRRIILSEGTTVQEALMKTDVASPWSTGVQFSGCSITASLNSARYDYL